MYKKGNNMKKKLYCVKCKWCKEDYSRDVLACYHPDAKETSLITGKIYPKTCAVERLSNTGSCGKIGKNYND